MAPTNKLIGVRLLTLLVSTGSHISMPTTASVPPYVRFSYMLTPKLVPPLKPEATRGQHRRYGGSLNITPIALYTN